MNWNKCKLRIMPIFLLTICCLCGLIDSIQAQQVLDQQQFVQPEIEYGAWSPVVDLVDFPPEPKINRARSIQPSPPERQFVPKTQNKYRNSNFRGDGVKSFTRRNFETTSPQDQSAEKKSEAPTLRPAYKRRTFATSTTVSTPATVKKFESSAGSRFTKNYRKNASDAVTAKPRRAFTPRTTSENVLASASELPSSTKPSLPPLSARPSPLKKAPLVRGNFRPKTTSKEVDTDDGEENYPEHFKQLLKNKEVNTQENVKNVIKKPIKPFRPTSTSEKSIRPVTSTNKPKSNVLFPTRQNRFLPKVPISTTTTSTSTESPSSSSQSVTVAPKRPLRTRSRPTERTRTNIGSTLQEPPTIKHSTPIYATKSPLAQESENYEDRVITQADGLKQIDPPISEYIPRTNSLGSSLSALKYSSRFRNSEVATKAGKEPSYQATVPTITTTPQLDLNDIDLERWREILPLAAELIHNDAEIMTQSPSQTVSIYEALAEILSKPTESLSFLNNKSTESTLKSEAPFSSTSSSTTSTSTTTSTTTEKPTTSEKPAAYEVDIKKNKSSIHKADDATPMINNELVTTISSVNNNNDNNTEVTATNVQATVPTVPFLSPKNNINSITFETLIPMTIFIDTTTEVPIDTNSITEIPFNDTETTTLSDTNDIFEFSTSLNNLIIKNNKNETNGRVNGTNITNDIDQLAFPSTNYPQFTSLLPNSSMPTTLTSKIEVTLPKLDLMTRKIGRKIDSDKDFRTSSLFPVYRPNFRSESSTEPMKPLKTSTEIETLITTETPVTTYSPKDRLTTLISKKAAPFSKMPTLKTTKAPVAIKSQNITTQMPKINRMRNLTKPYPIPPDPTELTKVISTSQNPLNISLSEIIQFNKYLATPNNPNERVVYAVLSNNTVVRKLIREPKIVADQQIVYGILPNGTLVRKYRNGTLIRDDMSIEITNIDPKSLINAKNDTYKPQNNMRWYKSTTTKNYLPKTSTEMTTRTKMENPSLILDLLQKYQNETDTQVKSQNIFSLAKKTHQHELDHISHSENEVNNINHIQPAVASTQESTKTTQQIEERPTTQSTVAVNKVSIHPNGIDSSTAPTTTTVELPKTTRDSFENEISFDELEAKTFGTTTTLSPTPKTSVEVTRTTSSVSTQRSTIPETTRETTQRRTIPQTTSTSFFEETSQTVPTTTVNYIERNFKALESLLASSKKSESTTTENIIEKNFKSLEELLGSAIKAPKTTSTASVSTENYIEKNFKTLEELLGSATKATKSVPTSTESFIDKNFKTLEELLGSQRKDKGITSTEPTTTENHIEKNFKALEKLLGSTRKETTTSQTIATSTENSIEKNFKALEKLLGSTRKQTTISQTTPTSTENSVEKNFKALERLLGSTKKQTTTSQTIPTTTESNAERNFKALERLLGSSRKTSKNVISTTEIPLTTTSTRVELATTTSRKIPTQLSTESTRYTEAISSVKPIQQTTVQTTAQSTTQSVFTDSISTSTSAVPKTTLRFTPFEIPSDPPTKKVIVGTTQAPKKKKPFSDQDDLDFLQQLARFINGGAATVTVRKPVTTTSKPSTVTIPSTLATTSISKTTSTSTVATTSTVPSTVASTTISIPLTTTSISSSTPQITTKKATSRVPTTYSDSEDIAFLNSLRDYAGIINLTTERSVLAQKILELALNRTSKSVDPKKPAINKLEAMKPAPFSTTQSPDTMLNKIANAQKDINMMSAIIEENKNGKVQTKLSTEDIEKTKKMLQKDLVQYNKDIQLLSLLIGRPLNERDIAKLAATNLGKTNTKQPFVPLPSSTSTTLGTTVLQTSSSTSPIPAFKQLSDSEAKFLQALQQIQTTKMSSTTTSTTTSTTARPIITQVTQAARTRSQEALIAELLKQQGIGPANINQIPIDLIIEQLSNNKQRDAIFKQTTTTIRPFSPMPPRRQPRPIIDGLSWLWRTWQETAPGYQTPPRQQQPSFPSFSQPIQTQQTQQSIQSVQSVQPISSVDDDLSFDDPPDSQNNGFAGPSPLGAGGFLGAAIGVTRAVSRFLGVALTGAGQVLQGAFSGGSSASNPNGLGLFGSSRL